ncbi:MAG TPA: TonB-dependent receptor [Candidatus Limnocylindria bacterium]|nr:TonB-dependent receptor [Candidatus Limnocylindria bacterium]
MRKIPMMLVALLIFIGWNATVVTAAMAQGGKGTIKGHVTDTSDAVLQGAEVRLDPTDVKVASNSQGEFFINDLDPGSYTITVSYVGFKTLTKTVNVVAGQVANVEAKLELQSQNQEVLVTAERASAEAEAVNRERTADNLVQVLPDEVIRSLPNANMADALGRLPSVTIERDEGEGKYVQVRGTEPRLTNTTIDGINVPSPEGGIRQIKFDAIPADIVESVEINKTLQANMDGDGIGGSVNLVTKTAGERPTANLSAMGGFTPILGGRGLIETTGTVGQRFGKSKRFGLLIGGSYDWNGRGIDDIEPVPDTANFPGGSTARYFEAIDIREYRYYRSRWGLAGSADYKLVEGSNIYMRGIYSDFHNYGDVWIYSLTDNTPVLNPPQYPNGITLQGSNGCSIDPTTGIESCTGGPSFRNQIRRPDYAIGSFLVGGKHVLSTTWYAWDLSASRSRQIGQLGERTASFSSNLPSSSCQFDLANTKSQYLPQWTPACFTEAYTNQTTIALSRMQISHGLTAQLNLQATGAMAKQYHLGSHSATLEFGGKFRNGHKFANTFRDNYSPTGTGPTITMADFTNGFSNGNYYQGAYKLGPNPSFTAVNAAFNATGPTNPANYNIVRDISSQFDLIEKVSAGYLMNTVNFSKIRLVAGVRFEGTNLDTSAPVLDADGNFLGITKSSGSYVKVLPSASLRFALKNNTNLRLVYSRGLSRPDPQEIAQPLSVDATGNPIAVSFGNPSLKSETADNVDVLIEHYINPFGMITAGYFYKNLRDPIVSQTLTVTTGTFGGSTCTTTVSCRITQPFNAGSAWINGFEAAYLQHLSFLPGALRGLGLSANYGYTTSRTSFGPDFGRSDHPRLVRNAPHTWNISPTYDRGRVSIRVGLSYNAANIVGYGDGTPGPFGDNYFYPHLQFDAQGSVRMSHGLQFVMYGLNINNEVFGFYNGSPQYMLQREYYRPTIAAGMRWSPLHETRK